MFGGEFLASKEVRAELLALASSVCAAAKWRSCRTWSLSKDVLKRLNPACKLVFRAFATAFCASKMWLSWTAPVASAKKASFMISNWGSFPLMWARSSESKALSSQVHSATLEQVEQHCDYDHGERRWEFWSQRPACIIVNRIHKSNLPASRGDVGRACEKVTIRGTHRRTNMKVILWFVMFFGLSGFSGQVSFTKYSQPLSDQPVHAQVGWIQNDKIQS